MKITAHIFDLRTVSQVKADDREKTEKKTYHQHLYYKTGQNRPIGEYIAWCIWEQRLKDKRVHPPIGKPTLLNKGHTGLC